MALQKIDFKKVLGNNLKTLKEILDWTKAPYVTSPTGTDAFFRTYNSDTNTTVSLGVGAGGTNHGVWSGTMQKWLLYGDGTDVKVNNVPIYSPKILWSGAVWPNENQTISTTASDPNYRLSESISSQAHGIILAWSAYSSGTAQNYNWVYSFVPKTHASHGGPGINFTLSTEGFGTVGSKYLYISGTQIVGNAKNDDTGTANGITYKNNYWVLREVIGI